MTEDSPGKNVVQIVKCRDCGKRFQTRVLTRAALCPKCTEAISFDRKAEPAPTAAVAEPAARPAPAPRPPTSRTPGRYVQRRSSRGRRFLRSNTLKMLMAFVLIAIAFGGALLLFTLEGNREAERLRAIKENQRSQNPPPTPGPGPDPDPGSDPLAPVEDPDRARSDRPTSDQPPPNPAVEDEAPPEP